MTDTTFFGYNRFYPNLYTQDEARVLRAKILADLWPLVLDICFASDNNLFISSVRHDGQFVLLVDKHGIPAMEVACNNYGRYGINNWYHRIKKRGQNRYAIESANRSYILKAIRPFLEPIARDTKISLNSQLLQAGVSARHYINEATNNAATIRDCQLPVEKLFPLLETLFNPAKTMMPPDLYNELSTLHNDIKTKLNNKKSHKERLYDLLAPPKWLIAVTKQFADNYLMIGNVKYMVSDEYTIKFEYLTQPTLYRSFQQFYEQHPEHEASLKSALMFCKVHREGLTDHLKTTYDPEGFLPCSNRAVYEDIGGISYCNVVTATVTSPHILLLQQ